MSRVFFRASRTVRGPLLAFSGNPTDTFQCPLSGQERTSQLPLDPVKSENVMGQKFAVMPPNAGVYRFKHSFFR
jgi:hypothetical protein